MEQKSCAVARLSITASYILISIDQYENGVCTGSISNSYLPRPESFCGIGEMVLKMERIYDYLSIPQATREHRSFNKAKSSQHCSGPTEYRQYPSAVRNGRMATLLVQTRYRQNGTWQGTVFWREQKKQMNYISALQLMQLVQESVESRCQVKDLPNEGENDDLWLREM